MKKRFEKESDYSKMQPRKGFYSQKQGIHFIHVGEKRKKAIQKFKKNANP